MAKIISTTKIEETKGVNAFSLFCQRHKPFITWRPTSTNDYGIDGEIELAKTNSEGKLESTGEILKIQIKSTEKGSYIRNDTEEGFEFIAKRNDLEYWEKIKFDVLLVVYFSKKDELYAKKIEGLDIERAKKNIPIAFCKKEDQLKEGVDILERYSHSFRNRINYKVEETLFSNIFEFRILPKYLFIYDSKISTKKEIFDRIDPMECPLFALYGKKIYSFVPAAHFSRFHELAIESNAEDKRYFTYFLKDPKSKRIGIELINLVFRDFCKRKKIGFNKKFGRYYFKRDDNSQKILKVPYISHKGRESNRTVIKYVNMARINSIAILHLK